MEVFLDEGLDIYTKKSATITRPDSLQLWSTQQYHGENKLIFYEMMMRSAIVLQGRIQEFKFGGGGRT